MQNVPKLDVNSKSDCFVVLYQVKNRMKQMIGKSEVIWDSVNPSFVTQFEVDYKFEEAQEMICEAYDMDDEKNANNLKKQDFIGAVTFQLSQVVSSMDQTAQFTIKHQKGNCTLVVSAEEKVMTASETVVIQFNTQQQGHGYFYLIWKSLG